jgi:glutamate-1-semialdehyde 2,1-aminomutase
MSLEERQRGVDEYDVVVDEVCASNLLAEETSKYISQRPVSHSLWERGKKSMVGGVPMTWMCNLLSGAPPIFIASGSGSYFTDVDGHRYFDVNQADMSMQCGYGTHQIVKAVSEQAAKGTHFLLPTEDSIVVSEILAERFGLPFWQYTLSATSANTEIIRLTRIVSGRSKVLMFDGGYHGHIEDTLIEMNAQRELVSLYQPIPREKRDADVLLVEYNDLQSALTLLETKEIACVLIEPAITNCGIIAPKSDFLHQLFEAAQRCGSYFVLDETHTQVCGLGGLLRMWSLRCDAIILGKVIGGGIPLGAYGMSEKLASYIRPHEEHLPLGGTLFGNALSMASARATLTHVLTEEGFLRTAELGEMMATGMEKIITQMKLPWVIQRLYCRTGLVFARTFPSSALQAKAVDVCDFRALMRVFMANRGVWEAIASAGPCVSFAATEDDIHFYLSVFSQFAEACKKCYRQKVPAS